MQKTLPDEQGWYWAKSRTTGQWDMVFVSTYKETVTLFAGDGPEYDGDEASFDEAETWDRDWYGPIQCPGGDMGSGTILVAEEDYEKAEREKKAIAITYLDYRYLRDEGHGSSLTITGIVSREEADQMIKREVPEIQTVKSMECDRCDGCGWYEGGEALQTTCKKCDGRGWVTMK